MAMWKERVPVISRSYVLGTTDRCDVTLSAPTHEPRKSSPRVDSLDSEKDALPILHFHVLGPGELQEPDAAVAHWWNPVVESNTTRGCTHLL